MSLSEKEMEMLADKVAARLRKTKSAKSEDSDDMKTSDSKIEKKDKTSLGLLIGFAKKKKK